MNLSCSLSCKSRYGRRLASSTARAPSRWVCLLLIILCDSEEPRTITLGTFRLTFSISPRAFYINQAIGTPLYDDPFLAYTMELVNIFDDLLLVPVPAWLPSPHRDIRLPWLLFTRSSSTPLWGTLSQPWEHSKEILCDHTRCVTILLKDNPGWKVPEVVSKSMGRG